MRYSLLLLIGFACLGLAAKPPCAKADVSLEVQSAIGLIPLEPDAPETRLNLALGRAVEGSAFLLPDQPARAVGLIEAVGHDTINLAPHDLHLEPDVLAALARDHGLPLVSANVRRANGERLLPAYRVIDTVIGRMAVIGVTADQAAFAPHERVTVTAPADALAELLPVVEAEAEADLVVVLAWMDRVAAAALLRRFERIDLVWHGGSGLADAEPLALPEGQLLQTPRAEWSVAHTALAPDGTEAVTVREHGFRAGPRAFAEALRERILALDAAVTSPLTGLAGHAEAFPEAAEVAGARARPAALRPGTVHPLGERHANRGLTWTLHSVAVRDRYGALSAARGGALLVLDVEWTNRIPMTLVHEHEMPTEYRIENLADHVYIVVDGVRLGRLHPEAAELPGHLPVAPVRLERLGVRRRGNLVFELPVADPGTLELRFYDFAHGHMDVPLTQYAEPAEAADDEPVSPPVANEIVEVGVYGVRTMAVLGERAAPAGMTFLALDFRARSMFRYEADASAFDPAAEPGARTEVGTVADWLEAHRYMHLVVDGVYAYRPESGDAEAGAPLTTLPSEPRFLPERMTGGRVVFLIPEDFESLALRGDFPNARLPDGRTIRPEPIDLPLRGVPPALPAHEPIERIEDDTIAVELLDQRVAEAFAGTEAGDDERFLVLEVAVHGIGDRPEFFQALEQLQYVDESGQMHALHEATFAGVRRPSERVWIPDGETRRFEIAYQIGRDQRRPRLAYHGFTLAEVVMLPALD